jgi:lysyl-tRNA synthetase class 1
MARIVAALTDVAADDIASAEPRLTKADYWMKHLAPPEDRIEVRVTPDVELLQSLTPQQTTWLELLIDGLDDDWSLDGLRTLVYGVPKAEAGLAVDAAPTAELKANQREFFKLLYRLLLSVETGPRVPTLLMAIGREQLLKLLGG